MTNAEMPTDKAKVSAYIDEELKKDFERLADLESRSMSNLVEILIREAVEKAKQSGRLK